ncbi:MAG: hypothetical protein WCP06_10270 [Verrucomicrobiota bacterium]
MPSKFRFLAFAALTLLVVAVGIWWSAPAFRSLPPAPVLSRPEEPPKPAVADTEPSAAPTEALPTSPAVVPEPSPASEPLLADADVETRQRYFDQLAALPPLDILARWRRSAAGGLADDVTLALLQQAFAKALGAFPVDDPALLKAFLDALHDPAFPLPARVEFAQALAESATLPGCRALLQYATDSGTAEPDLRSAVFEAIGSIGASRRADGSFPSELSLPLEKAFGEALSKTGSQQELEAAVAQALGQVGTVAGTQQLLAALEQQPGAGPNAPQPDFKNLLREAIEHVRNPGAIPALLDVVQGSPNFGSALSDPALAASGSALVHIGNTQAVEPLLDWLQRAPSDAQPLAAKWFQNIRTPETETAVQNRLQTGTFNSIAIKTTLQELLKANAPK